MYSLRLLKTHFKYLTLVKENKPQDFRIQKIVLPDT